MADERLRVTVDDAYTRALGLACFTFARLEWDAYWCCEKIKPGELQALLTAPRPSTAGTVSSTLVRLAHTLPPSPRTTLIQECAADFSAIVKNVRNPLIHGKPGTAANGDQRLFQPNSSPWTIADVNRSSDEFTALQIRLNELVLSFP